MKNKAVDLSRHSHCVRKSMWHIEWCTKYRYKMMQKQENRKLVEACIRQAAHRHGIKILALEVMPEHVHAVVEAPHTMSADSIAHLLKGYSSWKLFRGREKCARRSPRRHFWSRSYMARTVG